MGSDGIAKSDGIEKIKIEYQDGSCYVVENDRKNILNMGYCLGDAADK